MTNLAFPALINKALKATEAKFPGVELRAIQDDIDAAGPPDLIFGSNQDGSDGALHFLLEQLAELRLEPNKSKFQFYATTERAAERAPNWLPRPFFITDPDRRAAVDGLEATEAAAAANARSAPPGERVSAEAAAANAKEEAEAARADVPNEYRAHGVITCGAALGDAPFIVGDLKKSASDPPEKRQKKCLLETRTKIGLTDKNSGTNGQFLFRLGTFFVRLGPLFCPLVHFFVRWTTFLSVGSLY